MPSVCFGFWLKFSYFSYSGRNSQSVGGMAAEDHTDSDDESFVSRVGSYAFTDIGKGSSSRALGADDAGSGTTGAGGVGGGGCCVLSPTSTLLRSTTVRSLPG